MKPILLLIAIFLLMQGCGDSSKKLFSGEAGNEFKYNLILKNMEDGNMHYRIKIEPIKIQQFYNIMQEEKNDFESEIKKVAGDFKNECRDSEGKPKYLDLSGLARCEALQIIMYKNYSADILYKVSLYDKDDFLLTEIHGKIKLFDDSSNTFEQLLISEGKSIIGNSYFKKIHRVKVAAGI
jgi:hypothetical protein